MTSPNVIIHGGGIFSNIFKPLAKKGMQALGGLGKSALSQGRQYVQERLPPQLQEFGNKAFDKAEGYSNRAMGQLNDRFGGDEDPEDPMDEIQPLRQPPVRPALRRQQAEDADDGFESRPIMRRPATARRTGARRPARQGAVARRPARRPARQGAVARRPARRPARQGAVARRPARQGGAGRTKRARRGGVINIRPRGRGVRVRGVRRPRVRKGRKRVGGKINRGSLNSKLKALLL